MRICASIIPAASHFSFHAPAGSSGIVYDADFAKSSLFAQRNSEISEYEIHERGLNSLDAVLFLRVASQTKGKTVRLIRFGERGRERPGIVLGDGTRVDVSAFGHDYDEAFFGSDGISSLRAWLDRHHNSASRVPAAVRWGPPICRPSKIVCIGLNFRDHAAESRMEIPQEPVLFFKSTTALAGPFDPVIMPRGGRKLDWEVELAVIVGTKAAYVSKEKASGFIAGYTLHNDYSERAFQLERGGQWVKGKSADTFAPIGPFLATPDEVPEPQRLRLWLKVNGELRQSGTTANMIFDVPTLVSYVSQFMTLLPGDVISTGTPAGVGLGREPEAYLKLGDSVNLGIDGLGESRQQVIAAPQ